ncbi:MAG: hypothetical protein P8H38_08925 [Flavobacteriaceae bacterium]|nr:hypothetical protein [Flavobacteriaceae bacterium]
MKWNIPFWASLCVGTYIGFAQSHYIQHNRSLICAQMSLDNSNH